MSDYNLPRASGLPTDVLEAIKNDGALQFGDQSKLAEKTGEGAHVREQVNAFLFRYDWSKPNGRVVCLWDRTPGCEHWAFVQIAPENISYPFKSAFVRLPQNPATKPSARSPVPTKSQPDVDDLLRWSVDLKRLTKAEAKEMVERSMQRTDALKEHASVEAAEEAGEIIDRTMTEAGATHLSGPAMMSNVRGMDFAADNPTEGGQAHGAESDAAGAAGEGRKDGATPNPKSPAEAPTAKAAGATAEERLLSGIGDDLEAALESAAVAKGSK